MVERLVKEIYSGLHNRCYLSALTTALTLPDICGKAKYPNEKTTKRYKQWLNDHVCTKQPYLIYLIPDEFNNLQTIVTAIIAAVYGGLLTLVGVAWTIRKQDQIRREDDKKLYRPIVVVANSWDSNFKKVLLTKFSNELISYEKRENLPIETYLNSICIQNTEFTPFYIFGVLIDNTYMLAENKIYVDRNGGFVISCEQQLLHTKTEIDSVSLIIRDLLGNYYKIPLKMNKVISNKIEQPIFRQGTIILLNKSIPQIHCIDEMVAKELNNFSLNED